MSACGLGFRGSLVGSAAALFACWFDAMRRVLIVQARMTSTRLPGKVLMDVAGRPMLERQLQRLMRCSRVDEVVLAVTRNPHDEPLLTLARRLGVRWFRGSEHDVLSRYRGAAREADADLVIRVTADCPLIDPEETDTVVAALEERQATCDYASNGLERSLPRGSRLRRSGATCWSAWIASPCQRPRANM